MTEFTAQGGRLNDLMGLAGNLMDLLIYEIPVPIWSLSATPVFLSISVSVLFGGDHTQTSWDAIVQPVVWKLY